MARESYIVLIYRRDPRDIRKVNGLIETADGTRSTIPFTTLDELCDALKAPSRGEAAKNSCPPAVRRKKVRRAAPCKR